MNNVFPSQLVTDQTQTFHGAKRIIYTTPSAVITLVVNSNGSFLVYTDLGSGQSRGIGGGPAGPGVVNDFFSVIYNFPKDAPVNNGDYMAYNTDSGLVEWTSGMATIKKSLTASQILDWVANPVPLSINPGAGKMIQVLGVEYNYTFVTTKYDNGGGGDPAIMVKCGGASSPLAIDSSVLGSLISTPGGMALQGGVGTIYPNADLYITGDAAFLGDGTIDVYVTYKIITL